MDNFIPYLIGFLKLAVVALTVGCASWYTSAPISVDLCDVPQVDIPYKGPPLLVYPELKYQVA
jgi:hypothetical protein